MEKRTDKRESKKKVAGVSNSSSPRAPLASALPSKFSLEVYQVSALILVNESTFSNRNFVVRDIFRYDFFSLLFLWVPESKCIVGETAFMLKLHRLQDNLTPMTLASCLR